MGQREWLYTHKLLYCNNMILSSHAFSEAYGAENQDAFLTRKLKPNVFFAAVADGVGGHAGGSIAANIAIATAEELLEGNCDFAFSEVCDQICSRMEQKSAVSPDLSEMATTLTLVVITGSHARFCHIGDSRIYHLRNKGLIQVTEDQSEVALLLRQGILDKESAKKYPRKSVLYSALSARRNFEINEGDFNILENDRVVLMTDGAYRLAPKKQIRDFSLTSANAVAFVDKIAAHVANRGAKDDYTIVCVESIAEPCEE